MKLNKNEKARFRAYWARFTDKNVPFRQKWVSGWRYIGMLFGLIGEKIKGVDYAMISNVEVEIPEYGNYTMSPNKVMKKVFSEIDDASETGFIDIGCGKGYVVKKAAKKGFKIFGGVEYNEKLYDVCISNLKKEKVSTENVILGDAQTFEHYDKFDYFYFNNPFGAPILRETVKKIKEAHANDKCTCFFLNPKYTESAKAFTDNGFVLEKILKDNSESYFTINIYKYDSSKK